MRIVLYVMCGKCRKCINRYIYETSNQPKNGLSPEPRRCDVNGVGAAQCVARPGQLGV